MARAEIELSLNNLYQLMRSAQDAALETMGALRTEVVSAQVTPRDQGTLENSGGAVDQYVESDEIHTTLVAGDTPYARRLYFHPEYNFQTVNNPNAQGEWLEPWLPGGDLEGFVPATYEERLKERME